MSSAKSFVRLRSPAVLPVVVALLAGCATVTRGTTEPLVIVTNPSGASVEIMPVGIRCTTPCTVELKRKKNYMIELSKEGLRTTHMQVAPATTKAGRVGMAGNVLIGGLVGMGVDAATGAIKGLTPNPVQVLLLPATPVPTVALDDLPPPGIAQPRLEDLMVADPPPAPNPNCIQPSIVDRETCLGHLPLDMPKNEIIRLLSTPDGTSRDGTTFRYGDRYLKIDTGDKLVQISDRPI